MGKKNKKEKKEKKLRVRPPLKYNISDVTKLAKTIITINPYMKDRTVDQMVYSIMDTINRAFNEGSWFVSTAGYFCYFDEWDENTFVEFYVKNDMVHDKLFHVEAL
jgi:hypothetical protein